MANGVIVGRYTTEATALNAPSWLLTDNDTFTSMLYIDSSLPKALDPANPLVGDLEHADNALDVAGKALVVNQATVFVGDNELLDARSLEGRYQAQFPEEDVRIAPVQVSIALQSAW